MPLVPSSEWHWLQREKSFGPALNQSSSSGILSIHWLWSTIHWANEASSRTYTNRFIFEWPVPQYSVQYSAWRWPSPSGRSTVAAFGSRTSLPGMPVG